MDQTTWEARKQRRIDRMRALAEKARARSEQFDKARKGISDYIPFGQPILIGHHSEKRHRRDLDRIHRYCEKSVEEYQKAQYYDRRADQAERNTTISGDDPEAVRKLKEKLLGLENLQALMVAANKIYRKGNTPENIAALVKLGISEASAVNGFTPDFCGRLGFADYQLTNNSGNMRRIRLRIASLEKASKDETAETEINGIRFVDNVEDNRFQVFFPGKPAENIRSHLKHSGFRWSPTSGAWQRFRKNSWHNEHDIEMISKLVSPAPAPVQYPALSPAA